MSNQASWLGHEEPLYNETELERQLSEADLDAVVARSGRNVVYLSGMRLPGTLARHQDFVWSPRPVLIVWPREGDPTLITTEIGRGLADESSWIEDVTVYAEYAESPWKACHAELAALGVDDGSIGIERQELTVDQWQEFTDGLPDAEVRDCTGLLNRVRNIKTPREIEVLRDAVNVQDRAHLEVFGSASSGDTEKELHAQMIEFMIREGAEWAHGMLQSDNRMIKYGGEGPVSITTGDLLKTDYVSYHSGYAANLSRMAVMGTPTAEQRETYQELLEIHRAIIAETMHPGVEAQEVWMALRDQFREHGYDSVGGLAGHSTGVWWHQEEPIFRQGETTRLKPGMVVCLEPILEEYWHLQDQILITDSGPEILSETFPIDELFVMDE